MSPSEEPMSRRFVSNLIVALGVALSAPLGLRAQTSTTSPEPVRSWSDRFTLGGAFGGLSGSGLEYRFGRVGLRGEGRDFVYRFDRYGFDKTWPDIAWQGGLTLPF